MRGSKRVCALYGYFADMWMKSRKSKPWRETNKVPRERIAKHEAFNKGALCLCLFACQLDRKQKCIECTQKKWKDPDLCYVRQ